MSRQKYQPHIHREGEDCVTCRLVWEKLLADPAFVAAMERGKADLAAGRFTPFRRRPPSEEAPAR